MKKNNLFLTILASLLFVSCSDNCRNDYRPPVDINAQKLIGTWNNSYVIDLDSVAKSLDLPLLNLITFGKATFNYEWTFNEDKKTGTVNAFLDYKGDKINAANHPKNFEYTATETDITFPKFPYESIEKAYEFTVNIFYLPIAAFISIFGKVEFPIDVDISTPYAIEEDKQLILRLYSLSDAEYIKLPK